MSGILTLKKVTKYYGNGGSVVKALNEVDLAMEKGEFVAIMGPSGSGKSTLLSVIATIEPPSGGDIIIDNKSLRGMKEKEMAAFRRDKLGFVFQDYNLLDTLTAEENILLPLHLQKRNEMEKESILSSLSLRLSIEKLLKKYPREMSGGERQRTALARALSTSPSLVLADEPTGALDSKNSKIIMDLFSKINRDMGATILMVTHDAYVGSFASRVLFLKDGGIWNMLYKGDRSREEMKMLNRLALRNVKGQWGSYLLYFLTVAFTVSMLFAVENLLYSKELMDIASMLSDISQIINFSVVLVSIVSAIVLG